LLGRFKSVSTLSIILSAFMAFPSNIPLSLPMGSTPVPWGSTGAIKVSTTLNRKPDRISLLEWADSSTVVDNAEETDDTPLPPGILPRYDDLSSLIPSSIQARRPDRSEVFAIAFRNPLLRC
jgi:hypothetical protein